MKTYISQTGTNGWGPPKKLQPPCINWGRPDKKQSLLLSVGGYHIVNSHTIVPQKYSERGSIESTQMCNLIELQVLDKKHRYMFGRAIALSPNFSRGQKVCWCSCGVYIVSGVWSVWGVWCHTTGVWSVWSVWCSCGVCFSGTVSGVCGCCGVCCVVCIGCDVVLLWGVSVYGWHCIGCVRVQKTRYDWSFSAGALLGATFASWSIEMSRNDGTFSNKLLM